MQNHCIALFFYLLTNIFIIICKVYAHLRLFYIKNNKSFRIIYSKNNTIMKNKHLQKRSNTVKQKVIIESLVFQTNWGLKKLYEAPNDFIETLVKIELDYIVELNLFEDLLMIKKFVDDVKSTFDIEPVAERGDFCRSPVAIALGIGKVDDITKIRTPIAWHELLAKKLLSIYYPTDMRNSIADYAKNNGYNTSTYFGKPMIKFNVIFLLLERAR